MTSGDARVVRRAEQFLAVVRERWGPTDIDDIYGHTLLAQPGEIMTRAERNVRFPDLAAKLRPALDDVDWADVSHAMATVRSQSGFVARLMSVYNRNHAFSETERAYLSLLAALTSLALSG
jgi:hypothetical protein